MKKVHIVIKINQNDWLKPYIIDMNTTQKAKTNFEKDFFKLMNKAIFRKTMENVIEYTDIKPVITETRRIYLVSEPNYDTIKFFTDNLIAIEMQKTQILMNKSVYLGLLILDRKQ